MKPSTKTLRLVLIGLGVTVLVIGGISIVPLKRVTEFVYSEDVKGYWASLQDFVNKNERYPTNGAEIGIFFKMSPKELQQAPVEYLAPHDTNADEVVLWWKQKTIFGVKVGITESGMVVKK